MIPRQLKLKNFLSYGPKPQTVDFSSHHLICLSGKNGHGKSALLDAITWALWGMARKALGGNRADLDLIHLGQSQMIVIFDFEFNNAVYRVRREYAHQANKPFSALDFGMFDASKDAFIPLTDKTVRTTQAIIDRTLNLTFESFVNSAFLRQGQSNEFSKKTPKDRKNILANILGLDQYESIRRLATEKAKKAGTERDMLATLEATMSEQLKQKEISEQYELITQKLVSHDAQEAGLAEEKKQIDEQQKLLAERTAQHTVMIRQLQQLQADEVAHHHTLRMIRGEWRRVHGQLLASNDPQLLNDKKQRLSHAIHQHQQQLQEQLSTKEKLLHKREEIRAIEQRLLEAYTHKSHAKKITIERLSIEKKNLEQALLDAQRNQEQTMKEVAAIQAQKEALEKQKTHTAALAQQYAQSTAQFEKRKEYYQSFVAQANWMSKELESLAHKQEAVHDESNPSCPLCEQNLSASRKRFLKTTFSRQELFIQHRLQRLTRIIKTLKAILVEHHAQRTALQKQCDEAHTITARFEELGKTESKLQALLQELSLQQGRHTQELAYKTALSAQEEAALQHLETQRDQAFQQDAEYKTKKTDIDALEHHMNALRYDPQEHKDALNQMQLVDAQLAAHAHMQEQRIAQEHRKHTLAELCTQLKQLKVHLQTIHHALQAYHDLAEQENNLKTNILRHNTAIHTLQQEKNLLMHDKGRLEQQMIRMRQLEQEHKEQQLRIAELNKNIDDYQLIAHATSKDGVQALLIEDAVPEIEQEANALLAKLTNNQAQISIESLKDLKKGGTKETLDIKISDASGIRPYELFSGGEAFRIDFALRIAISKLLARRSGASLQTLIIDEGFGSQDEEGLGHIMDAIHAIQEDFSKVIIVSHLPTMKDQFPVHFVVEKGTQGSIVHVIEQG